MGYFFEKPIEFVIWVMEVSECKFADFKQICISASKRACPRTGSQKFQMDVSEVISNWQLAIGRKITLSAEQL